VEYIQLDRREGNVGETCKYCGLRYKMKGHHHHAHIDPFPKPDLPAGRAPSAKI
jgi:hypothetical protein